LGYLAGDHNITGSANAILGYAAGYGVSNNSFSSSTIMGYQAGYSLTTGNDNILLGFQAGNSITTGHDNIIIGYNEDTPSATTSSHLNIGGAIYGDLSTGNVGIGTTSPDGTLHVFDASAGLVTAHVNANAGIFEDGSSNGISILSPDTSTGTIFFGSPSSNRGAEITWENSVNRMSIGPRNTGASLRLYSGNAVVSMFLKSDGNVGIGTTNPQAKLEVAETDKKSFQVKPETNYVSLWVEGVEVAIMKP